MRKNYSETEIEEIIRTSIKIADVPTSELNNKLKAELYQRETALRKQSATHKLSLWYLPMILNLILFSLFAIFAVIVIENTYLSYFIAGISLYAGVAGIVLTIAGIKRANIKEDITIRIEKRGVFA